MHINDSFAVFLGRAFLQLFYSWKQSEQKEFCPEEFTELHGAQKTGVSLAELFLFAEVFCLRKRTTDIQKNANINHHFSKNKNQTDRIIGGIMDIFFIFFFFNCSF